MKKLRSLFWRVAFSLVLVITSANAALPSSVWTALVTDYLTKYAANNKIENICPSLPECLKEIDSWDHIERESLTVSQILAKLIRKNRSELEISKQQAQVQSTLHWFEEKYGIFDRPVLSLATDKAEGSFTRPRRYGKLRFKMGEAKTPKFFNPAEESSIQDLNSYIGRKWGGLQGLASSDRIIFSELGSTDTITALREQGYNELYHVNAPYSMRGSKTLLAKHPSDPNPKIVFFSFVSQDLLLHKVLQLALVFGEDFKNVKVLSSNNFRSWEIAEHVVQQALKALPEIKIDDLVIGYSKQIEENLLKRAKLITVVPVKTKEGQFASIKYFTVKGKNENERTIALLTDVALRYFGKSALTLVRPFLDKHIDRVIFAGSGGCFNPEVPVHSLVIPKEFYLLTDDGEVAPRINVTNDLFSVLPMGVSYSGKHLSVQSPLVESQSLAKKLRDQHDILTVDVEGSQIAKLISDYNEKHGTRIRFAATFVVTDTPVATGEKAKEGYGLHKPDYEGKSIAKKNYVSALNLLWDLPTQFNPSNHMMLITRYYSEQIRDLVQREDSVALGVIYWEIQKRLSEINEHSARDLRVSNGLVKGYLDLLRQLDKLGVTPLNPEYDTVIEEGKTLHPISKAHQRIVLLQSLTRSATLNQAKTGEVQKILNAVDLVLKTKRNLNRKDLDAMNPSAQFREFTYHSMDGNVTTSKQAFDEFLVWLKKAPLEPATALEAFLRFEHIHPYADGNGRRAELLAQHIMLRATGHPLLFPHRFDVDYILSLKRNGSFDVSNAIYLEKLIEDSRAFSKWLENVLPTDQIKSSGINPLTGLVEITKKSGEKFVLKTKFKSERRIKLEKEEREFLAPHNRFDSKALVLERVQYKVGFSCEQLLSEAQIDILAANPKSDLLSK